MWRNEFVSELYSYYIANYVCSVEIVNFELCSM